MLLRVYRNTTHQLSKGSTVRLSRSGDSREEVDKRGTTVLARICWEGGRGRECLDCESMVI